MIFDVDFTLIEPGPMFRAEGYEAFCEKYGIAVNKARFGRAVASASRVLDEADTVYDAERFIAYTARIIEQMGGQGDRVVECAREIYDEWARCHHFEMYEEAPAVLRALASAGLRLGLISNSHRSLTEFESHFELQGLIGAAVSSAEHGRMKPHPSIFEAALKLLDVRAGEALMVGDTLAHDVEGALAVGMRAVLVHRAGGPHPREAELAARGVPVIASLRDLTR
ncbi:MAG TPA: HAD family hydrolase, partial [Vicinamibacterales bacterium]|nr:HAD family hydrolase [Vicinamibacterales bacterium]